MKVTTLDGGFRGRRPGLGNLTTAQQLAEVEAFQARLIDFDRSSDEIVQRLREGSLPEAEAIEMDRARTELRAAIDAHVASSSNLTKSEDLLAWRSEAGRLVGLAQRFVEQSSSALRTESMTRPWKIGLALVLGTAAVGAAVWGFSKVQ